MSLISISSFVLGSFVFARACVRAPRKRRNLVCSFCTQAFFIILAAALLEGNVIPANCEGDKAGSLGNCRFLKLIPLAMLAFQASGQMAASHLLDFPELPTTVLTSVYYDIAADPGLFQPLSGNVKRNRRLNAIIALVGGAVIGGWICRSTGGISTSLWIAAASKVCIAIIWWFWKTAEDGPSDDWPREGVEMPLAGD